MNLSLSRPAAGGPPGPRSVAGWMLRKAISCRILTLLSIQIMVFSGIYLGSYFVRFDGDVSPAWWAAAVGTLPMVLAVKLALSFAMGSHRGWWRYATFADMVLLAETTTLGLGGVVPDRPGRPLPPALPAARSS